ncbi:MAG TPA: hypothetical protein PK458_20250 [Phycisphaerae bacterium]|nr:hypothetical protein [Phycisphaerae bacterium]
MSFRTGAVSPVLNVSGELGSRVAVIPPSVYAMQMATGSQIALAHAANMPVWRAAGFTWSFWIKSAGFAGNRTILAEIDSMGGGTEYFWIHSGLSGSVHASLATMSGSFSYTIASNVADGAWHHVVFYCHPLNGVFGGYVDGVKAFEDVQEFQTLDFPFDTTILGETGVAESCELDDVAAFGSVLTQADVTMLYNLGRPTRVLAHVKSPDLVGYWRMGDGAVFDSGSWTIPDESPNGNHGTSSGILESARVKRT